MKDVSTRSPTGADGFDSFGLHPSLLRAVRGLGFEKPTPIQSISIGPLLEGRDLMAAAATGSGKTAAFLLPILHRLLGAPRGKTRALVLAPTRELAQQTADHLRELARHTRLSGAAVFGGVGHRPQIAAFRRGVDVLVATPGRLLDHFDYDYARLDALDFLVLDEADRMLDMGFLPDVKRIMARLPERRQTMLFSATMPPPIVKFSREILHDPVALNLKRRSAPAKGITHLAYPVDDKLKPSLLAELLSQTSHESVLAFTRTKHRANRLADFLEKRGVPCTRIHGNRSQTRRTEALAGFKEGRYRVLVATDIAARGIDIEELALVVNVDVPNLPEDYIHRVGRTARADAVGVAITLVSRKEEGDLSRIERHLGSRLPRERLPGFDYARAPAELFEVPVAERIAEIRRRKAEDRARSKEKAARRAAADRTTQPGTKTPGWEGGEPGDNTRPPRKKRGRTPNRGPAPRMGSGRGPRPGSPGRGSQRSRHR